MGDTRSLIVTILFSPFYLFDRCIDGIRSWWSNCNYLPWKGRDMKEILLYAPLREAVRVIHEQDPRLLEWVSGSTGVILGISLMLLAHSGTPYLMAGILQLVGVSRWNRMGRGLFAILAFSNWSVLLAYFFATKKYIGGVILSPLAVLTLLLIFILLTPEPTEGERGRHQ